MDRFHSILYALRPSPVGGCTGNLFSHRVDVARGWLAGWSATPTWADITAPELARPLDSDSAPEGASLGRLPFRNGNYVPSTGEEDAVLGFSVSLLLRNHFASREDLASTSQASSSLAAAAPSPQTGCVLAATPARRDKEEFKDQIRDVGPRRVAG